MAASDSVSVKSLSPGTISVGRESSPGLDDIQEAYNSSKRVLGCWIAIDCVIVHECVDEAHLKVHPTIDKFVAKLLSGALRSTLAGRSPDDDSPSDFLTIYVKKRQYHFHISVERSLVLLALVKTASEDRDEDVFQWMSEVKAKYLYKTKAESERFDEIMQQLQGQYNMQFTAMADDPFSFLLKTGFFWKCGGRIKTWYQRHFELYASGQLHYWASPIKREKKGSIDLMKSGTVSVSVFDPIESVKKFKKMAEASAKPRRRQKRTGSFSKHFSLGGKKKTTTPAASGYASDTGPRETTETPLKKKKSKRKWSKRKSAPDSSQSEADASDGEEVEDEKVQEPVAKTSLSWFSSPFHKAETTSALKESEESPAMAGLPLAVLSDDRAVDGAMDEEKTIDDSSGEILVPQMYFGLTVSSKKREYMFVLESESERNEWYAVMRGIVELGSDYYAQITDATNRLSVIERRWRTRVHPFLLEIGDVASMTPRSTAARVGSAGNLQLAEQRFLKGVQKAQAMHTEVENALKQCTILSEECTVKLKYTLLADRIMRRVHALRDRLEQSKSTISAYQTRATELAKVVKDAKRKKKRSETTGSGPFKHMGKHKRVHSELSGGSQVVLSDEVLVKMPSSIGGRVTLTGILTGTTAPMFERRRVFIHTTFMKIDAKIAAESATAAARDRGLVWLLKDISKVRNGAEASKSRFSALKKLKKRSSKKDLSGTSATSSGGSGDPNVLVIKHKSGSKLELKFTNEGESDMWQTTLQALLYKWGVR